MNRLYGCLWYGLSVVLILLAVCQHVSMAVETTTPPLEFIDNRESVVYRMDDLKNEGLTIGLVNNTEKSLTVTVSLVDPVSEVGSRPGINAMLLVSPTGVKLPAKSVITARLGVEVSNKVDAGRYAALLVISDGQGTLLRKKVTIVQGDPFWPWPTLCILAGVLISYFLTIVRTSWKPRHLLETRRTNLYEKIKEDFKEFDAANPGKPYVGYSIVQHARERLEKVKLEAEQGQLQEALTHLQEADTLFQSFRQFRTDQVLRLYRSYERLVELFRDDWETNTPHLVDNTMEQLTGHEFESDLHLKARQSELLKWSSFVDEWQTIYEQLIEAEGYGRALSGYNQWPSPEDQTRYQKSCTSLNSARGYLWTATSAQALTSHDVAAMVHRSWSTLHWLWEANHQPTIPPPAPVPTKGKFSEGIKLACDICADKLKVAYDLMHKGMSRILDLGRMRWTEWLWSFFDASALLLSFFSAVAAGLLALYFTNSTFGGLQDYLAAFLWGAGVDQGVKGLAAISQKLGITAPS
ncbi:MAG: hypothetical protein PHT62_08185 [Desulfotomaculaceae bacterium]|nr:hypothetical protein [Desulfotomaculaceae bacterium]